MKGFMPCMDELVYSNKLFVFVCVITIFYLHLINKYWFEELWANLRVSYRDGILVKTFSFVFMSLV